MRETNCKEKAIKVKYNQHAIKPFNGLNLSIFQFTAISNKIVNGSGLMMQLQCRSSYTVTHKDLHHQLFSVVSDSQKGHFFLSFFFCLQLFLREKKQFQVHESDFRSTNSSVSANLFHQSLLYLKIFFLFSVLIKGIQAITFLKMSYNKKTPT